MITKRDIIMAALLTGMSISAFSAGYYCPHPDPFQDSGQLLSSQGGPKAAYQDPFGYWFTAEDINNDSQAAPILRDIILHAKANSEGGIVILTVSSDKPRVIKRNT